MINVVTILFSTGVFSSKEDTEEIATVGKISIEREQLRDELEKRYGEDVLTSLIDEEVIKQTAEKYGITVSEDELARELHFIKTQYSSYDQQYLQSKKAWEDKIKNKILLEKVLTHNVKIPDQDLEAAYEKNQASFKLPTAYHLSHIVVKKKKEAKQIYKELQDGASFKALALEKSIDDLSAPQKGDIGYITKDHKRYPAVYREKAAELKEGTYSKPIKIENGYAIIYLHDRLKKKTYTFKEVKSMLERQLALEEMNGPISADLLWGEADVEWKYQNQK